MVALEAAFSEQTSTGASTLRLRDTHSKMVVSVDVTTEIQVKKKQKQNKKILFRLQKNVVGKFCKTKEGGAGAILQRSVVNAALTS